MTRTRTYAATNDRLASEHVPGQEDSQFQIESTVPPDSESDSDFDDRKDKMKYRQLERVPFSNENCQKRAMRHRNDYMDFQNEYVSQRGFDFTSRRDAEYDYTGLYTSKISNGPSTSNIITPARNPFEIEQTRQPSYMKKMLKTVSEPVMTEDSSDERPETIDARWDPIGFAMRNLYDMKRGVPLSRPQCEEQIATKLSKNNREVDYFPFLELAQSFHKKDSKMEQLSLGLAFSTIMNNKLAQKLKKTSSRITPEADTCSGNGFSLKNARINEPEILLPSGKTFRMSDLMDSVKAARFTSTNFEEHSKTLFRICFKKLATRDEFFPAYCATDYSTQGYYPLGNEFYTKTSKFVIQGFSQPVDDDIQSLCACAAREVITNLPDRIRRELKFKRNICTTTILGKLNHHLERFGDEIERAPIEYNAAPQLNLHCLE
uniref:TF_AP-2 domain-containing protein n=1 Tax=Caenorhabditis tropicalis TaxID=1561998 RepID=A0A1I7URF8_9PELO